MAIKKIIDGEKLGAMLEAKTHKSLKEISLENGFSKNFLGEAIRNNRATAPVISVAKIYGIELESYEIKDEPKTATESPREGEQISLDDLSQMRRDELKPIIKEALTEIITEDRLKPIIKEAMREIIEEREAKKCKKV